MRDTKSSLLLVLSLLLLSLSLVLLSIWGYNFYGSSQKEKKAATINITPPVSDAANTFHDSLQKVYTSTINTLDTRIDSSKNTADSQLTHGDTKLGEINKLKEEIGTILKNNNSIADLGTAREKIDELQLKVEELRIRNLDIERENKRLSALLKQVNNNTKAGADQNIKTFNSSIKLPVEKASITPAFFVSDLRLSAVTAVDGKEEETSDADETEKMNVSFIVKSRNNETSSADVIIVALQPNGYVFQNSVWESGTFDTPEGKKNYSQKIHFNYSNGEATQLHYSLNSDKFQKGSYVVQVYYNGSVIGRMVKTLF